MSDPTDQEIFDATMSDEPVQDAPAEPVAQPEPPSAVARDEAGRFASREAGDGEPQPVGDEPAQAGAEPKEPPPHRFREISERARRAEERAQQLEQMLIQQLKPQQPAQPAEPPANPDLWENPDAWADHKVKATVDPVMQQMHKVLMHNARLVATSIHGQDKITAAEQAFNDAAKQGALDPAEYQRVQNDPNPFDAAVRWHQKHSLLSKIGDDPEAYEKQVIANYLASQQQPAAVTAQPGNIVKLPPSLNKATSAASMSAPGNSDVSDAELFNQTTRRR